MWPGAFSQVGRIEPSDSAARQSGGWGGTLAGFQATFMMLFEVGAQNAIIDKFSQRAGSDIVAGLSAQFFTHLFKDRIAEYHLGKRLGGRGSFVFQSSWMYLRLKVSLLK